MTTFPCALCLARNAETEEHIIPRSIGGGLALPILCKACNDELGHTIDAAALKSGPIQHAAFKLKDKLPWPWRSIGPGVKVSSMSADVPMQVEKGTGEPQVQPHRDPVTGAIWQPRSELGKKEVKKSLTRQVRTVRRMGGAADFDIDELATRITKLEDGEVLDLPQLGLKFVGKQDKGIEYKTGPPLSHRYPARIAYLSLAAAGVDLKEPSLESWRRYIRGEIDDPLKASVIVSREKPATEEPTPMHSVRLDDVGHGAFVVDLMLFGCWTWRCLFLLKRPPHVRFFAYAINLGTGDAAFSADPAEWEKGIVYPVPAPDPKLGWGKGR